MYIHTYRHTDPLTSCIGAFAPKNEENMNYSGLVEGGGYPDINSSTTKQPLIFLCVFSINV